MRLLPRSLFSRMVLILLSGLVVAQLLSFAIQWQERGQLVLRASGMRSAQRIADIVRLLDSMAPAERNRIVGVIDSPALHISLAAPPLARPQDVDPEKEDRAARFAGILRRLLGDEWPLVVVVSDAPAWRPQGRGPGQGPGQGYGPGPGAGAGPGYGPEPGSGPGPGYGRGRE